MIRRMRVLNAHYSGLETKFPSGRELEMNSSILLLVGPNGAGKTALMRMIASSLRNKQFFEENGFARRMYHEDELGRRTRGLLEEFVYGKTGGRSIILPLVERLRNIRQEDRYEVLDPNEKKAIALIAESLSNEPPFVEETVPTQRFLEWSAQVSEKGYDADEVIELAKHVKRETCLIQGDLGSCFRERVGQESVFAHMGRIIKTRPEGRGRHDLLEDLVYLVREGQGFGGNVFDGYGRATREETRTYLTESMRARLQEHFDSFSEQSDQNMWGYLSLDMTPERPFFFEYHLPTDPNEINREGANPKDDAPYSHFRENNQRRAEESPGSALREDIDKLFGNVRLLLERAQTYEYAGYLGDKDLEGVGENPFNLSRSPYRHLEGFRLVQHGNPEDNQAIVLMDEPTIYLDYQNTILFQRRLIETGEKFGQRVQFIIPTNDAFLIESLQGQCRYINLYNTPATSERELDISAGGIA